MVGLLVGVLLPRIRRAIIRAQEAVGSIGAGLDRALGAARTVKASGAEAREEKVVADAAGAAMLGQDIAGLSRAQVRQRIGYVEQEVPALSGTVLANLRYAAPAPPTRRSPRCSG